MFAVKTPEGLVPASSIKEAEDIQLRLFEGTDFIEDAQETAFNKAIKREQNVNEQISEKAQLQAQSLRPDQYGGYKTTHD